MTAVDGREGRDALSLKSSPLSWQHMVGRDPTRQVPLPEEQRLGVPHLGPQPLRAAPERRPPQHLAQKEAQYLGKHIKP